MTQSVRIRHRPVPAPGPSVSDVDEVCAIFAADEPAAGSAEDAEQDQAASYSIGYGKPPHYTRFKEGRSGNPRGRPKGSPSIGLLVTSELNQRVTVRENGQTHRIRKRDLMAKQLVKKGAEGDLKALVQIMRLEAEGARLDQTVSSVNNEDSGFTPERDSEIIAQFRATFGPGNAKPSDDERETGQ